MKLAMIGSYGHTNVVLNSAALEDLAALRAAVDKAGVRIAAMQSNVTRPDYPGAEDNGGMLLELAGGGHAVIRFDYLRPKAAGVDRRHGDDRLRIAGTQGVVEVVDEGTRVVLMTPTEVAEIPLAPPRDLFAEFAASVADGSECIVTPAESFAITEVALKARDAADQGVIVDL